jgi:hypothetical protein
MEDEPSYVPPGAKSAPLMTPEEREDLAVREWFAMLPPDLRPFQLLEAFPTVALRIIDVWGQPVKCNQVLDQLLIAKREGRQGFPPAVAQELLALGVYYKEKYAALIGLRDI